jgi:hypothetical protein
MSKRSDRRAAEREAHKLAYQQLRQPNPAAVQIVQSPEPAAAPESDLLARAQAFFDPRIEPAPAPTVTPAAQILANQANAKLSTGPTTPAGKAISSRNHIATVSPAPPKPTTSASSQPKSKPTLTPPGPISAPNGSPTPLPSTISSIAWSCISGCVTAPYACRKLSSTPKLAKSRILRNSTCIAATERPMNAASTKHSPTSSAPRLPASPANWV